MSVDARRTFGPTVLLGIGAAVLAAVASAKPWAEPGDTAGSVSGGAPIDPRVADAAGQVPLASALSLLVLAFWGVLLVSRGRGRRMLAGLGAVGAVALTAVTITAPWSATDAVRRAVSGETGASDSTVPVGLTPWFWVALMMVLLTTACLLLATRYASAWPAMSARYDRPEGADAPVRHEPRTNQELWKAIDEGDDLG